MGATLALTAVKGSVHIHHGPSGCGIILTHFRSENVPSGTYVPILSTGVKEPDLIHGGGTKLSEAIKDAIQKYRNTPPKLIWITTGCATSIVCDDIKGVANKIEEETGIKVIAVDTAGFQGTYIAGADSIYRALLENYAEEGLSRKNNRINIIGPILTGSKNWLQDFMEIRRLLQEADVEVNNVLTFNTDVEELERFGEASANYILTSEELPEFEQYSRRLGVESWGYDLVLPLGITNTEEWYLKVAEKFGNVDKAKGQLKKEMEWLRNRLTLDYNASWFLQEMMGKRCGIIGRAAFAAALARCLFYDFNARPMVIALIAQSQRAIESARALLQEMGENLDFKLLINPTYLEYGMSMREAGVHFAIGEMVEQHLTEGLSITTIPMGGFYFMNHFNFIPWPFMGIRGMLNLMTEIAFYLHYGVLSERERIAACSYIDTMME